MYNKCLFKQGLVDLKSNYTSMSMHYADILKAVKRIVLDE